MSLTIHILISIIPPFLMEGEGERLSIEDSKRGRWGGERGKEEGEIVGKEMEGSENEEGDGERNG